MAEPATKKAKSEAVSYSQQRAVVLGNIKALGVLKEEALRGEFTREDFLIFDQSLEIEISALTRLNNEQTGVADAKIDGLVASITEAVADLKSAQVADLKDCMRAVCSAADKLSFEGIDRLHHAIGSLPPGDGKCKGKGKVKKFGPPGWTETQYEEEMARLFRLHGRTPQLRLALDALIPEDPAINLVRTGA